MSIHIVQLGKRKFVCGLFWQSLSRPRELGQEARALAHKIDADLLVLRRDQTMAQAGYANTGEGARRGLCSLACVVARRVAQEGVHYNGQQQAAHNWLAAFALPDGMWVYLAVRDANFLPNGDFAGSRADVLERLHHDYALGGWNVVLGAPELAQQGFHNFHPRELTQLLHFKKNGQPDAPAWALLASVQRQHPAGRWLRLAGAAAALAVAGGAAWQYHAAKVERERRALALEAARRELAGMPAAAPPPWYGLPPAAATAQACGAALQRFAPGGWILDQYVCTPTVATHVWRRGDSHLGLLLAELPTATVDGSGELATLNTPLAAQPGAQERLQTTSAVVYPLLARLQLLGLQSTLAERPAPAPPPGSAAQPPPAWRSYTLVVQLGAMRPQDAAPLFDAPGLRLEKLSYRTGTWSIEGVIYAN
jgi:hypothetical protein